MKLSRRIREQKERVIALAEGPESEMMQILKKWYQTKDGGKFENLHLENGRLKDENRRLNCLLKETRLAFREETARREKCDRALAHMKRVLQENNVNISDDLGEMLESLTDYDDNSFAKNRRRSSSFSRTALSDSELSFDVFSTDTEEEFCSNARPIRSSTPPIKSPAKKLQRNQAPSQKAGAINHVFQFKTVTKTEACSACGKNMRFGRVVDRCKKCKLSCHVKCKSQMITCNPPNTKSLRPKRKDNIGPLAKYLPKMDPQIPKILALLINEIETRGQAECGIYRVPGVKPVVNQLVKEIGKGRMPYLGNRDVHSICSVLKEWLSRLEEPLITSASRQEFLDSVHCISKQDGIAKLKKLVNELPSANRETLAFLVMHLQRVSTWRQCNMPVSNLAKVFGPTIVGQDTNESLNENSFLEVRQQNAVVERLLLISCDYWSSFLLILSDDDCSTPKKRHIEDTPSSMKFSSPKFLKRFVAKRPGFGTPRSLNV